MTFTPGARCPQSLSDRGTQDPSDVIQNCLVQFRHPDRFDAQLLRYLHPAPTPDHPSETDVAAIETAFSRGAQLSDSPQPPRLLVPHNGPLAQWASVLDVGARRVLPGHLLRRSTVLSTLHAVPSHYQQRVAVTACHGEVAVLEWSLRYELSPRAVPRWVVKSVTRDGAASDHPLPGAPHPKASPEAIVLAQLQSLRGGAVAEAATFNMWGLKSQDRVSSGSRTSASPQLEDTCAPVLDVHYDTFKAVLQSSPFHTLLHHASVEVGEAALLSQRCQVQRVRVRGDGRDGGSHTGAWFEWELGMQANGCWMVTGIRPCGV
jgi:hypothetical protein